MPVEPPGAAVQADGTGSGGRFVKAQDFFEVTQEARVAVIRCLGTWDRDMALDFRNSLLELLQPWAAEGPWASLVDFTDWRPATPDVTELGNGTRDLLDAAGRCHGAILFGSLGVAEKLVEKGVVDPASQRVQYFHKEEDARAWLESLGYLPADPRNPAGA